MNKVTRCEKCNESDAIVFFSAVTGKGKATRKRYCRKCAEEEKIKLVPQTLLQGKADESVSLLGMVQKEMAKGDDHNPKINETPEATVNRLNKEMKTAIDKEDYEKAAKIRDQINAIREVERRKLGLPKEGSGLL